MSKAYAIRRMSGSVLALFVVAALVAAMGRPVLAAEQQQLTFVAAAGTVDTVISEVILRKAYRKLGIVIAIKKYPGERALKLANAGRVAGDVQRIDGLSAKYPNLIQVRPAINFIESSVFSKTVRFTVTGWDSLRRHRIGLIRGIKFAEINTKGMNAKLQQDYVDAWKNVINSAITLEQEYANKAGWNTSVPEATLKTIRDITEQTLKAYETQNKIAVGSAEGTTEAFNAFNENTKSFASLNRNIMESMMSTFQQKSKT